MLVSTPSRDKFDPWKGDFAPPMIPSWVDANASVSQESRRWRQLQNGVRDTGYFFPDPGLFFGVAQKWKASDFMKQWMHIQAVWTLRTYRSSSQPLSPQEWRDVLSIGFMTADKGNMTKSANALSKARKLIGDCLNDAGIEERSLARPPPRGPLDQQAADPRLGRILIWKLCELNFRWELRALDCRLYDRSMFRPVQRQQMLLDCFVTMHNSLSDLDISNARSGLASSSAEERLRYIEALWRLMSDWHGVKPPGWYQRPMTYVKSPETDQWERVVTSFYAQTFFEYFYRPAILPCTLYETDILRN